MANVETHFQIYSENTIQKKGSYHIASCSEGVYKFSALQLLTSYQVYNSSGIYNEISLS